MAKILDYINLIRARQWYKNLVIFLALFFVAQLFNSGLLFLAGLGFVALCLASSANYIINDLIDLPKDKLNPEKKHRPLASGTVNKSSAIVLAIILLIVSLILSYSLSRWFFYSVMGLVVLTQVYSLWLKEVIFADILSIATLFVIRAISGALLIDVKISPWLILCPFFLSLFLSVGKRHSEITLLKEKSGETRKVLKEYNHGLTNSLMTISTTLLIISYALYSFLSEHQNLLFTLPFALFVIFRFYYLINSGSEIARHPEKVIKDRTMIVGMVLWVLVTLVLIYVPL
ncbi:UbiA prenyltransferase family protein [Candidatus Woesearchaeota archaeon]|nr:UbiA prenyltransferase family protein [Candidatus Woesearchaeota archaeon]